MFSDIMPNAARKNATHPHRYLTVTNNGVIRGHRAMTSPFGATQNILPLLFKQRESWSANSQYNHCH